MTAPSIHRRDLRVGLSVVTFGLYLPFGTRHLRRPESARWTHADRSRFLARLSFGAPHLRHLRHLGRLPDRSGSPSSKAQWPRFAQDTFIIAIILDVASYATVFVTNFITTRFNKTNSIASSKSSNRTSERRRASGLSRHASAPASSPFSSGESRSGWASPRGSFRFRVAGSQSSKRWSGAVATRVSSRCSSAKRLPTRSSRRACSASTMILWAPARSPAFTPPCVTRWDASTTARRDRVRHAIRQPRSPCRGARPSQHAFVVAPKWRRMRPGNRCSLDTTPSVLPNLWRKPFRGVRGPFKSSSRRSRSRRCL